MKALSQLLGVSIDYLLENGENLDKTVIKEAIDLSKFEDNNRYEKKNKIVRQKYPNAKINPLLAKTKATNGQRIFDTVLGLVTDAPFGTIDVYNDLKNTDKQYYLVEDDDKQFLVLVTDDFIISREPVQKQYADKFKIGDIKFTKCTYLVPLRLFTFLSVAVFRLPIWIFKKFRLAENKMAYNRGKEERKWRIWKGSEEKVLREYGTDENTIEQLRAYDREAFNSDRRFYQ